MRDIIEIREDEVHISILNLCPSMNYMGARDFAFWLFSTSGMGKVNNRQWKLHILFIVSLFALVPNWSLIDKKLNQYIEYNDQELERGAEWNYVREIFKKECAGA